MRPIRELPADVVNQIAAGEVVERPSSAVKELLENAIDAGAGRIDVETIEGGRELIRVVDDGCGIGRDQLPLAVRAHATSKLTGADDLFRIRTLGFRGEALSAIAGVSDFTIRSRPPEQSTGAEFTVLQGKPGTVVECGCPIGTQVEVRNLFAGVPVRRKFLKSRQTELGHISDAMTRIGLASPAVSLRLVHNDRVVFERPGHLDRRATISLFFGSDVAEALLPIEAEMEGVRVHGLVCDPRIDRPNQRSQYLFVNGRFFRDRSLQHAIAEAYRGLLMTNRHPVAFVFLELPPDQVDVNVHPTKTEVRFQNPQLAFSLVLNAIKSRFLSSDLAAKWRVARDRAAESARMAENVGGPAEPFPAKAPLLEAAANAYSARKAELERRFTLSPTAPTPASSLWNDAPAHAKPGSRVAAAVPTAVIEHGVAKSAAATQANAVSGPGSAVPPPPPDAAPLPPASKAIQLHNSYLVVETDDGMMLIDQHALHERILYEELKKKVGGKQVEIQELLVPEPVELTPVQAGLLLEQKEVLARAGIRIEDFGPRCVLLQSYPAMLRRLDPDDLLRSIAGRLEETGNAPSHAQLLEELLHMMACKAAVKAGDPLDAGEIESLLARRRDVEDSHHCPHGRPTVLKFTLRDLERQFKRT